MSKASFIAAILQSAASISTAMGGAPAGVVLPYAGAAAPTGWLLCHGQAISRTTYPELFAAIGTAYGAGDGSTTFNAPDMRGRVAGGKDDMGGAAAGRLTAAGGVAGTTLGAAGGGETHTLTVAQMPSHAHGVNDTGHAHAFASGLAWTNGGPQTWGGGSAGNIGVQNMNAATTGITIQSQGSGAAHPNTQPTIVLNYIIRAA